MTKLIESLLTSKFPRKFYKGGLLLITSLLSFAALVLPIALRPSAYPLQIGDVSSQDITAPGTLSYTSEILTEKARQDAAAAVSSVYLPADPSIPRTQIDNLHIALNFINSVRSDSFASVDQKEKDLTALKTIQLSEEEATNLLNLSEEGWRTVQQESLSVLEQTMRKTIRENQVQDSRNSISALINFSLPEDQSSSVVALVTPFVIANSLYSEELTNQARNEATNSVAPVVKKYVAGQSIIQRGQVITPEQWEALEQFGLIKSGNKLKNYLSAASLVLVLSIFIYTYFKWRKLSARQDLRDLTVIAITFLFFLYGARFLIPNRAVLPYFYPLPAFALIIGSLVNFETSLIFTLVLSVLAAYDISYSLNITVLYAISSIFGLLILGKGKKISQFLLSAISISVSGSLIILAFRLIDTSTDWLGIATLIGVTFLNGFASSSIALLIQFFLSQALGLVSALNLIEISRPDHPLQHFIMQNAPGTYQHSLQVANLAEQAAEAIGADPILVRAGALYHDAGKALNPQFFIENQIPGKIDPHDKMDPILAAQTIIAHVTDGIKLANKYRIPPRIKDFIYEHHGTLITRYQYIRALEAAENDPSKVDVELFRYPGPNPRSKETVLLMFADRCEAKARAELPKDDEAILTLIKNVFDDCIKEGQLSSTNLSFRDLRIVESSFLKTLKNTYHPRIQYPDLTAQQIKAIESNSHGLEKL